MKSLKWSVPAMALCLCGPALAGTDIDETRALDADGSVYVGNVAGDIEISTWDRNEVRLTGELGDDSELEIDSSGSRFRVEVITEDKHHWGNHDETDLYLKVPARANISVNGVSSDITVTGAGGEELSAESVSGDVEVEGHVRRLELNSVSGDVVFEGSASRTSAETVSGDIELHGLSGEVEATLVSGDVNLRGGTFSRGQFESVSGTLELELGVEDGGRLTVESMSGDVNLRLANGTGGKLSAQTFSGDISSDWGSVDRAEHGPGRHLKTTMGEGNATIRVESFSGDIEIRR